MNGKKLLYLSIILPLKFAKEVFYYVTQDQLLGYAQKVSTDLNDIISNPDQHLIGERVSVLFAGKEYIGVIRKSFSFSDFNNLSDRGENFDYKSIDDFLYGVKVAPREIAFWSLLSEYYMCTIGEVYKAAYPSLAVKQEKVNSIYSAETQFVKIKESVAKERKIDFKLTDAQTQALTQIESQIDSKCVLLHGVTGSGKTEIYISLCEKTIAEGKNVLYLVPEIALSKQLELRLIRQFGERVFTYHSHLTQAKKKLLRQILQSQSADYEPIVILGTRSSLFLPFSRLGLIIVDEEHDSSYKQEEPAPRYNARDASIFLAKIHKAKILLGSATPSLESLYNCSKHLYSKVELSQKYYNSPPPDIIVVDTIYARKTNQMKGSFSLSLLKRIKDNLDKGEQSLIFCSLRSYSPVVICSDCGEIIRCPHCNVALSYHQYSNSLRCHYCDYHQHFTPDTHCPKCGKKTLNLLGAGSEKIESELKEIFPQARIARWDADIAQSKNESEKVLKQFSNSEIDILVGTQMVSKGFDFANLSLVAVIQTDTMFGLQNFRADEKALQLLEQLKGRVGRRDKKGLFIIQTNSKNHLVIDAIKGIVQQEDMPDSSGLFTSSFMTQRELFKFPPYVRLINITLKNKNISLLREEALELTKILQINLGSKAIEIIGPFVPPLEKIKDFYQLSFSIKFARNKQLIANKRNLNFILSAIKTKSQIIVDVDPI